MALVWQKKVADRNYEVRQAGASLRLYTNGVFHSQFNPNCILGGHVWDLLVLPALFAPEKIRRILILGLGGGAAVRTLQCLLPKRDISAVEIDATHIQIAKRFFGVRPNKHTTLIQADALEWLYNYRGEKFDFILDDLFIEDDGNPNRAINSNKHWFKQLQKQLSPHGIIAINFDSNVTWRKSALAIDLPCLNSFASRFVLSQSGYENRIVALSKLALSPKNIASNLQLQKTYLSNTLGRRINYKIRAI